MLNVVGPYRLYGEPVVRACAECGTDYLDVSGEPEFMERMEAKYNDMAAANGCRIASAAGYDSVPGDYGTILAQQEVRWIIGGAHTSVVFYQMDEDSRTQRSQPCTSSPLQFKPPSVPLSVEAYLAVIPGSLGYKAHFATWQSAVLGFASIPALRALRKSTAASKVSPVAVGPLGQRPRAPSGIEFISHPAIKSFSVPFPGKSAKTAR